MTRASLRYSFPAFVVLLFTACAPGHVLIDRADIDGIEDRLDRHDARLIVFEQDQAAANERLSLEQRLSTAALMQTMVAEFARLSCDPAPIPECPADARGDSEPVRQQGGRIVLQINDRQVVGGTEKVLLSPPGLVLEARIDTGAESASLDARDIQEFERDGNRWVRFNLVDRGTGESFAIERRIVRHVRILQSSQTSADEAERRPVVEFRLTLGEVSQTAEFTLSDRSHLSFPVLIGRNVLQDLMVVDVGRNHIAPPRIVPAGRDD